MNKYTYGELLYRFAKVRKIKKEELCEGICSVATLKRYENGTRNPSPFLFELLMERMGIPEEELSLMVTESDYQYCVWKDATLDVITIEDWESVEKKIREADTNEAYTDEPVKRQFYYYVKAVCEIHIYKRYEKAVEYLLLAISQTIPDIYQIERNEIIIGRTEAHYVTMYIYYKIYCGLISKEDGKRYFYMMENYFSSSKIEKIERAKIYPKVICAGLNMLGSVIDKDEQLRLCKKAMQLLKDTRTFYDITEILRLYIPLLAEKDDSNLSYYQTQYEIFGEIYHYAGIENVFRIEQIAARKSNYYILNELFYSKRKEKQYTQEYISEGICEPETYSRIETGKHFPKNQKMQALAEKCGINWCYYRGELDSYDFRVFRLRWHARIAGAECSWAEQLTIIKQLEDLLEMDSVVNHQYVQKEKVWVQYQLQMIETREALAKLQEALTLTTHMDMTKQDLIYYSQTEFEIIAHIAKLMSRCGEHEKAIYMLETALKQCEKGQIAFKYQLNGIFYIISILSDLYKETEEYEAAIRAIEYVLKDYIKIRDGVYLSALFFSLAQNYNCLGEQYKEQCQHLHRWATSMAEFYDNKYMSDLLKKTEY